MGFGSVDLQILASLVVVLGALFVALICDLLKGNNELLREKNIELRVRMEERERWQQELAGVSRWQAASLSQSHQQRTDTLVSDRRNWAPEVLRGKPTRTSREELERIVRIADRIRQRAEESRIERVLPKEHLVVAGGTGYVGDKVGRTGSEAESRTPVANVERTSEAASSGANEPAGESVISAGLSARSKPAACEEAEAGIQQARTSQEQNAEADRWTARELEPQRLDPNPTPASSGASPTSHPETGLEAAQALGTELSEKGFSVEQAGYHRTEPVDGASQESSGETEPEEFRAALTERMELQLSSASISGSSRRDVELEVAAVEEATESDDPEDAHGGNGSFSYRLRGQDSPGSGVVLPWPSSASAELGRDGLESTSPEISMERTALGVPTLEVPAGFCPPEVFRTLLEAPEPFTGVVVAVRFQLVDQDGRSRAPNYDAWWKLREVIEACLGPADFASSPTPDEFVILLPDLEGPAADLRVQEVTRRLWDFRLRATLASSTQVNFGVAEVKNVPLTEALEQARERIGNYTRTASRNPRLLDLSSYLRRASNRLSH